MNSDQTTKNIIEENRRLMCHRIHVFDLYSEQDNLREDCLKNIKAIVEEYGDWLVVEYDDIEPLILLKVY